VLAPVFTPRLLLRPFAGTDYAALRLIDGDPQVLRYRSRPEITPAVTLAFLVQADHDALVPLEARRQWALAGVRLADDQLIVQIGLTRALVRSDEAFMWYSTRRDCWGQGYASEAAAAVLRLGFEMLGFQRLFAECHPDNAASLRVMRKIGLRPEAHTAEEDARYPEHRNFHRCALSAAEWQWLAAEQAP
jgi:[ribosomal protein S5]-alanine N-acetyltransferase